MSISHKLHMVGRFVTESLD